MISYVLKELKIPGRRKDWNKKEEGKCKHFRGNEQDVTNQSTGFSVFSVYHGLLIHG